MDHRVLRQIESLNEDELEKDLRFLFNTRSDTVDQFIEEAIPMMKYHVNQVMADYQEHLLADITSQLRGEITTVMLRVRRDFVHEKPAVAEAASSDW